MKHLKLFEEFNHDEIMVDFNKQETVSYDGYLYHGTDIGKLKSILNSGIQLNEHREMKFDAISLSSNDRMINHFGGGSGLVFYVDYKNLLKLDDFYYELLVFESGIDTFETRGDKDMIQKAEKLGLKSRFGGYGIDNQYRFIDKYYHNNPRFENSEGIMVPGFDNPHHNAEAELVVTSQGVDKLWSNLTAVYINDDWYDIEKKEEIREALAEIEERESYDEG